MVVAQRALLRKFLGDVLDDGRNGRHAEVLSGPVAHVAGVDGAVCRIEDRAPPQEVRVGLDALHEVLKALVLDRPRVPRRRLQAVERHGLHGGLLNFSRHLARARNGEGRRFRRLSW